MAMGKSIFNRTIVSKQFTKLFALPVIGIGLIVLIGWFSSLMFLTRFSINEVPMAPSTAYVFIALAAGLWFYLRPQKIVINRNAAIASAVIVICLSCLLVITNIFKYYANWEHAFITIPETQLSMQLGHMSLVTALLFIISGFALLFLLSNRKIIKTSSIILTLIIFIISLTLLLAYGFGAPFFYFGSFIPPAVLTVLSFLLVSLALIAASDKDTLLVKTIWETSTSAKLLRIFLPTTIAITVIESLILIQILPLLNIHPAVGVSIVTLTVVAVVVVVILILSKSMGKSLDTAVKNLSESEERFRSLLMNMEAGIVVHAPDTSIVQNNFQATEIFGLSEDQMKGKIAIDPAWIFVKSDKTPLLLADYPVNRIADNNKPLKNQVLGVSHPDKNSITWLTVNGFPIMNNKGDITEIVISFIDITERKQAEEALRINEEKLNLIINSSPIGICTVDNLGNFVTTNPAYELTVGYSKEELVGLSFFDVTHPNDRPKNKKLFQDMFSLETTDFSMEKRYVRKDGEEIKVSVQAIGIRDAEGNVRFGTAFVDDITERKLAEELLRESEEKLNALFSSLTEIVVMHELVLNDAGEAINYRIIDCNNVFTEFTGIRKEDALGKLATDVYQTDVPPYLEEYSKVGLSGGSHEFNTFYAPLDKHLMISVVSPQHGKFATITTDITPMMQIQKAIIAKNKEMENYLYVASHDLRTPLVNIQGFSQRLKTQADSIKTLVTDKNVEPEILHQLANITDDNIPKTLNFIHSNIEKMDILINGLLQLSRTGTVVMNIQKIDMNELFAKIFHSLDFQIKETGCEIHVNSLPECYGDAALLDQLFTNIINNAMNYYDAGRPLEITVDAKKSFNNIIYTIKDTGKGIAKKHLDRIWDVFYRVDPKSGKAGEGIGLSLVKRIVEKHKGKIWVESEKNKGSVFHVELQKRTFTEF